MHKRTVSFLLCLFLVLLGVGMILFAAVGMDGGPGDDDGVFRMLVAICGGVAGFIGVCIGADACE